MAMRATVQERTFWMDNLTGQQGRIPVQFFSKWLRVYIPDTSIEATWPIPPEFEAYFDDCLHPPSILFFARAVLDSTAKLFNKSGPPEWSNSFPDKVKIPSSAKRIKEWKRLLEVLEADRAGKKSRILKHSGEERCSLELKWDEHPDWPDWPSSWPEPLSRDAIDEKQWMERAKSRAVSHLTIVR
jgi:hypothetical protein